MNDDARLAELEEQHQAKERRGGRSPATPGTTPAAAPSHPREMTDAEVSRRLAEAVKRLERGEFEDERAL
jgi:hypothetical protein